MRSLTPSVLLKIGFAGNREIENSSTLLWKEHIQEIMKRHIRPRVISLSRCGSVFSSRRENLETDLGNELIMLYRFEVHAKEIREGQNRVASEL